MSYFPEIAWGAIAKNVIPLYQEGTFQLNKYLIDVTPLDINEPGAMLMNCIVGDNFIDFLGYVYRIDNIESTAYGLKLLLYDINERSVSEYINYGPYQDRIGYVYRPTKYGIILSQAQILKLDSQARDRIGNIEKGVIWENLFHIDQTYPQTIFGGVPLFSSGLYTDFIDFNLESEIESQEGRLSWDNDAGTLKLGLPGGNVTGQLFQEMLEKVKNESGVTIANGKAVYVSGAVGRNIKIGLGDSTDYLKSFIFGVTTEEIANNGFGYICTRGKVGGINTSSWEVNDKLWLTTNGNMSNVPPEAPGIKVFVGVVLIKHATEGVIDIKPTFVPRMSGLSDVYGTPSLDGQVYSWDTTEQRFILRNLIDSYWEQTPITYELTYSDGEVFALNSMTVDSIITIGKASFLDYSRMKLQLGVDAIDNSYGLSQINNLYSSKIAAYTHDGKILYGRESGESGITLKRNGSTFYNVGFNNNNPIYPYHFKNGAVIIDGPSYGSGSLAFLNTDNGNIKPHYIGQRSYANGSKGIAIGNGTTDFVYFDIANSTIGLSTFDIEAWNTNFSAIEAFCSSIMFSKQSNAMHLNSNSYYTGTWKYKSSGLAANYLLYNGVHVFRTASAGTIDTELTWEQSLQVTQNGTFVDKKLFIGITSPPSVDTSGTLNSLVWDSSTGEVKQRNLIDSYSYYSLLPPTGEAGKIYITTDNNKTYRWSGSGYTEISPSLALGETSATAYCGDRGKIAYDHSQTTGNPHNTTFAQINSKPTTLAGYGITDAANSGHSHNYITTILSGTLPSTLTDYSSYCTNYNKGVSIIANAGGSAVGNIGASDTVVNFGAGSFRFFRLLNNRGGSLRWQTSNSDATDFAAERILFDNYNYASYCPDLSAIESISGTNGLLRKTATNTWTLDTNDYSLSTHQHSFASITSKPTTLSGYGITDAATSTHTHTFASITSKPTNLSGYGITDAYTKNNLQTSGGASVHWNNISNTPSTYTPAEHSHNYAGSITPSGTANSALLIKGTYTSQGGQQPPAYISSGYVRFNMMNTIINNDTSYKDFLLMDTYTGSDVPWVTAFGVAKSVVPKAFIMTGPKNGEEWASTAELLSTYNYATYTLSASLKGSANGIAELDGSGKVPSSQLPSYVDDVLEYTTFSLLPSVGESGKIYITTDTNKTYRWSGSIYTEISPSLALGETSATAYRGDCGKTAYEHSQVAGNPHSTTFAQLGSKPTTLAGYGITDAATSTHTHTFASITSKPTTLAGYGITDATPSSINNGRYITDGANLTGTYVGGSIRMSTQSGVTGYPSAYGITYSFDAATPSRAFSIFSPNKLNNLYFQKYNEAGVGFGWQKIYTSANLDPSNYLTKRYEPYSELTYGGSIIWDCSTGLNKTLTASGDFTINLTNLENGMSGDLRITSSTIITIALPSNSKLNGNVSNLPAGIYHLAWVYNGSVLDFNIALYE